MPSAHGNEASGAHGSPPQFDPTPFDISPYTFKVEKPWGWEVVWTPPELPYVGKVLHIEAGKRISLQLHDDKSETWLLLSGRARVTWQDSRGELVSTELLAGKGYSCAPGQVHRLEALETCEVAEVSTPETGTTWRLEDDYGRDHETHDQRQRASDA